MQSVPKQAEIRLDALAELAVDSWRLNRWINSKPMDDSLTVPKHVLRRLNKFLEECAITTVDFVGQPFDPGLAAEVIDAVIDDTLAEDSVEIIESISPMVLWENTTIKHAQIVIRHNPVSQG